MLRFGPGKFEGAMPLNQDLQTVTFRRDAIRADRLTEYRNRKFLDEDQGRYGSRRVTRRLVRPGNQVAIVGAGRAMHWHKSYDRIATGAGRE